MQAREENDFALVVRQSCSLLRQMDSHTACPPRRSFVASDARRRGQATPHRTQITTAFGAVLHTPAMLAGVHNTVDFTMIADT